MGVLEDEAGHTEKEGLKEKIRNKGHSKGAVFTNVPENVEKKVKKIPWMEK